MAQEERKIISWSRDINGKEFPIYDRPAPPSRYLPEGYDGPFTDEMIEEYLRAKGITSSPAGKTPSGKEYMAIMDLGLTKSPMFAPKPDEYYMDKWWNTTRPDGSARPMFPQASPVPPAAPGLAQVAPVAPVAPPAPSPAQPPVQQPRPLPPPEDPDEKALRINMEREAVRNSLREPIAMPMDKYADMTVPQNPKEWADLERRYIEEKGVEHQSEMERLADKDTADLEFKKAKALIDDWKKRMRKESVMWTGKPQGANFPGQTPVLITKMPGQQVPAASLSPAEVRAMGGLQDDRDDQAELDKAWDTVQKRPGLLEKVDRSYMAGKLMGVSSMAQSVGTVADIVGAKGVKKWTDERSADLMGAAEEKAKGGLSGIAGDVLQGYASIRGMGPMFKVLGKAALPVYEGLNAWAESNPDTEVTVPGFGKVKGRALPTLFGAVRGLLLHNILQTSSKQFGQVGARVASGAAFTAPDIIAKILTGNGLDVREIAANASMGAILGGPQSKGKPAKGVARIGYGGEVKEEEPIPDRIRQEYSLGGMEPEPTLAGNAVPDPIALPGRPTPQAATIKPKPELDAAFLGTNAQSRGPRKDTGPSMWSGPDPEEGPIMRMGYGGQQKDKTDFVVDPKTGLPKDPVKRTADLLLREKSGSMTKEVAGVGPTSEGVLKADKFLRDRAAKEAEPVVTKPAPGIDIGTKGKDKVIGYGTTDHRALKASGVEYLGEMGPGEKVVEAYDKSVADIAAYEGRPAGDSEVPDTAMLQDRPDLTKRPSHLSEIMPVRQILDEVVKISDTNQGELETGQRFFERAGGGLVNVLKDVFFEPIQRGGSEINRTVGDLAVELKEQMDAEGIKNTRTNTEKIGAFMTARQKGGTRVLGLSKYPHTVDADGKAVIDLTPGEKRIVDWMDQRLLQAYHEINKARVASGQQEIPWAEDYFTFWHLADVINRQGMNLISMPIKEVEAQIKRVQELTENELSQRQAAARNKSRMAKFMFTKRTGLLGPVDLDAFGVFNRYMHSAYEQIYFAEAQSIMKKIVDGRWKIDGKEWTMETGFEGQPETAQKTLKTSLSNYMGFLASGYQGDMNAVLYDVMSKLSRNAAVSKIGLNTKSVLNQLTSNVHSMVDLGPRVWMEGLGDYIAAKIEGGERAQEGKRVGNLANRSREIALEEFLKKRPRTALGRGYQMVGELSMKPLQFMDMVTADITWRGAYKSAYRGDLVDKGVKRGDVTAAADYANGEVTRTQGSTQKWDLAPLQRRRWGRIVSTLQNFVLNEFGFVTRDVFGYRNAQRSPENIKKVMGMMLGAFVVDWIYEQMGMTGPMNLLGNVYQLGKAGVTASKEKDADVGSVALGVGRELATQVPIVGRGFSSVYAGQTGGNVLGPAWDTLTKAPGVFLGKNRKASKMIESAGGLFGIPGAMPFKRAVETREKGGSWGQAVGSFTLGQKAPVKPKGTELKPRGGSRATGKDTELKPRGGKGSASDKELKRRGE